MNGPAAVLLKRSCRLCIIAKPKTVSSSERDDRRRHSIVPLNYCSLPPRVSTYARIRQVDRSHPSFGIYLGMYAACTHLGQVAFAVSS